MRTITLVLSLALLATVATWAGARGQSDYGSRLQSKDGQWLLPVATRLLGSTDDDHLARGSINSWDLSATVGSPVWAAAPGTVEAAGCFLYENRQWPIMQGYGCAVQIKHGNGVSSQYGHCLENSLRVRRGDQVTVNTLLCQVGRTGKTAWPHTHFTILHNGSPVRIDGLFDIRQMHYCKFCNPTNDPNTPVTNQVGATGANQQSAPVAENRLLRLLRVIAQQPAEQLASTVFMTTLALGFIIWLGGLWLRIIIVSAGSAMAGAALITILLMPVAPVQAGQQSAINGSDAWRQAYAFMRKWEGARCVHDPGRTFKGITNGTYNAWRRDQGLGPGDVCRDLTEQQAEAIYFQRYWLASGANRLSSATAIAVFDHAVNAGVGSAKGLLAQCGDNAQCVIQARYADYRTKRNFPQYGRAWFNRVNDMITFLRLVK